MPPRLTREDLDALAGVLVVPAEIARDLPRIADEIGSLEREIIDCCHGSGFTPGRLAEVWNSAVSRWPKPGNRPGRHIPEQP